MTLSNNIIGFFSSDSRKLYIDDIVKAISYPEGYIIQFRYQKKYIAQCYHDNLDSIVGDKGVIICTTGNVLGQVNPDLKHNPVRMVEVVNVVDHNDTDRVYFYLKLLGFCAAEGTIPDDKSNLFVKSIDQKIISSKFIEVVQRLNFKEYTSLFTILGCYQITKKGIVPLNLKIADDKKGSSYILDDESEYKFDVALYSKDGTGKCKFVSSDDLISFDNNYDESIGTIVDLRTNIFHTNSLTIEKYASSISVLVEDKDIDPIRISISICIQRKTHKALKFACFSLMSLVGISVGTKAFDLIKEQTSRGCGILLALGSLILVFIATYLLYKFFNKK